MPKINKIKRKIPIVLIIMLSFSLIVGASLLGRFLTVESEITVPNLFSYSNDNTTWFVMEDETLNLAFANLEPNTFSTKALYIKYQGTNSINLNWTITVETEGLTFQTRNNNTGLNITEYEFNTNDVLDLLIYVHANKMLASGTYTTTIEF